MRPTDDLDISQARSLVTAGKVMKPSAVQPAELFRPQSVALPLIKVKGTFTSNVRENALSYITPNTVIFIVPRQISWPYFHTSRCYAADIFSTHLLLLSATWVILIPSLFNTNPRKFKRCQTSEDLPGHNLVTL